jgi:ABC-2 type transport system permease protein
MSGAVFFETLRRDWRGMIWWGIGLGFMAWLQIVIIPDVESLQKMADLMESLPSFMVDAFGGGDIQYMATPEGYLTLRWYSLVVLILAVYTVSCGLNVTANDEDRGILDMLLSTPLPRWRLIVEKFAAYSILTAGIIAMTLGAMWIAMQMSPTISVDMSRLTVSSFNILPSALLIMAFTILIATIVRRRGLAGAIAAVFVVGSYFLDTLGQSASNETLVALNKLSFYNYYDSINVMKNGLAWGNVIGISAVALLMVSAGIWFFQRRDVGV